MLIKKKTLHYVQVLLDNCVFWKPWKVKSKQFHNFDEQYLINSFILDSIVIFMTSNG